MISGLAPDILSRYSQLSAKRSKFLLVLEIYQKLFQSITSTGAQNDQRAISKNN